MVASIKSNKSKIFSLNLIAIFWSRRYLVLTITSIVGSLALVLGLLTCNPWSAVLNIAIDKKFVSATEIVSRFDLVFSHDYPSASLKAFDKINVVQLRVVGKSSSVVSSTASSIDNIIRKIVIDTITSNYHIANFEFERLMLNLKILSSEKNTNTEILNGQFKDLVKKSNSISGYEYLDVTKNYYRWSSNINVRKERLPFSVLSFVVLSAIASFFISIVILGLLELNKKKKR